MNKKIKVIELLNKIYENEDEDKEEIDIQGIEEIAETINASSNIKEVRAVRINQLIRAVKQLDKKINKE